MGLLPSLDRVGVQVGVAGIWRLVRVRGRRPYLRWGLRHGARAKGDLDEFTNLKAV
jgi:hypothetical protein